MRAYIGANTDKLAAQTGKVCVVSTFPNVPGGALPSGAEPQKIALSIAAFCAACSVGRTFVYQEIAAGRLSARKAGRRTVIEAAEARRWLSSLQRIRPSRTPGVPGNDECAAARLGGAP